MSYTCTVGKDGRLYVFKIENGSKVRTKNIYANKCPRKQLQKCKTLCYSDNTPYRKVKTPCRFQKTVFTNKDEVKKYCKSRVKGDYSVSKRKKIAAEANKRLQEEKTDTKLLQTIKFKEEPTITTYHFVPTKSLRKPKSRKSNLSSF